MYWPRNLPASSHLRAQSFLSRSLFFFSYLSKANFFIFPFNTYVVNETLQLVPQTLKTRPPSRCLPLSGRTTVGVRNGWAQSKHLSAPRLTTTSFSLWVHFWQGEASRVCACVLEALPRWFWLVPSSTTQEYGWFKMTATSPLVTERRASHPLLWLKLQSHWSQPALCLLIPHQGKGPCGLGAP